MGFTTGLLGGFTLTTTLVYLSLQLHTQTRVRQASLLAQQSLVINNMVDPIPTLPPPPNREVKVGLVEEAKDRWNRELESNVRKLQNMDWERLRERMEDGVGSLWSRAIQGSREGVKEGVNKVK